MAKLSTAGKRVPADRIIAPAIPGPGYAVLMQGDHVVHQACGIKEGERITLVNGYTYLDPMVRDYTAIRQILHADPKPVVIAEYARHMALCCESLLSDTINNQPDYKIDVKAQTLLLQRARLELDDAILQLESLGHEEMHHFGA